MITERNATDRVDLTQFERLGLIRRYPPGFLLVRESDPAASILIIESGTVRMGGSHQVHGPGTLIGRREIVAHCLHRSWVRTETECLVRHIGAEVFLQMQRCTDLRFDEHH